MLKKGSNNSNNRKYARTHRGEPNMRKTVKIGGIGKSPVIEKINRVKEMESRYFAGELIKEKSLVHISEEGAKNLKKQYEIIDKFQINFLQKGDEE